jgi:hypothetical protein
VGFQFQQQLWKLGDITHRAAHFEGQVLVKNISVLRQRIYEHPSERTAIGKRQPSRLVKPVALPPRPRHARDEAAADEISHSCQYNWDSARLFLQS